MTAEEVLAKAADLVEQRWVQAFFPQDSDGLCAYAAIVRAGSSYEERTAALFAVCREVGLEAGGPEGGEAGRLGLWNDEPGRCKEEVATALRNAKRWL